MTRTIDIGSLAMNVIVCACVFLGGTCIYYPDALGIVSPRDEVAKAVKLNEDGSLPALSEQQLVSGDWRTE